MRKLISVFVLLISSLWAFPALADVTLSLSVMKEIVVKDSDGNEKIKHVKPEIMTPGTVAVYTVVFANEKQEVAESVVVNDPIPADMIYIAGSATGPGTAISFSVDGKTFAREGAVQVRGADGEMRLAALDEYRHIRWTLNAPLAPGKEGRGSFKARVQ